MTTQWVEWIEFESDHASWTVTDGTHSFVLRARCTDNECDEWTFYIDDYVSQFSFDLLLAQADCWCLLRQRISCQNPK